MGLILTAFYVDADSCPVRNEIIKVSERHGIKTYLVSDGGIRPHNGDLVKLVVVNQAADSADKWILDHISPIDILVTSDIPLALDCTKLGATVIKPNGDILTQSNIGPVSATRDLMTHLRELGEVTGGPKGFKKQDRSRFQNSLERVVQKSFRALN